VVYAGSDIIALSSLNEGTPVSLVEALASEKPVVSTRVGGVESIVEHGISGFLCDKDDTEAFAQHLATLVNDDTLRMQMGKAGPDHVRTRFSYQRLVRDMQAMYEGLLAKKGVNGG
jgi:glycosyltransferase involved in cell wall biosynthesis